MARVALIFLTLVLPVMAFVAGTWMHFAGVTGVGWWLIPALLVGGFLPAMLLGFRVQHRLLRVFTRVTAIVFGFLTYGLIAALACWVVAGVARLAGWPIGRRTLAEIVYGAAVLVVAYGLVNAAWIRVTRVKVALPNLPAAWKGRTVVVISDVHLGNVRGRRFARRIVTRVMRLRPDAVFIVGDMFDGARLDVDAVVQPWSELIAPQGVFFVGGNHDEFDDRRPLFAALRRVGLRVLDNEKVEVEGLQIAGVHDDEAGEPERYREILRGMQIDPTRASILLAHRPSNLEVPAAAGISLQVSGHTHGGQFWPWSQVVSRVHGRFARGLNRLGAMWVYTSTGVGTWGPPVRVGTRAEVVAIQL